ncbi:hypothetical protein BVY13_09510 [Bacillus amyloliquefaciens]|nr:hypothetical protein BVY13_09510 [Bacillus amyloliquefaciens]
MSQNKSQYDDNPDSFQHHDDQMQHTFHLFFQILFYHVLEPETESDTNLPVFFKSSENKSFTVYISIVE